VAGSEIESVESTGEPLRPRVQRLPVDAVSVPEMGEASLRGIPWAKASTSISSSWWIAQGRARSAMAALRVST